MEENFTIEQWRAIECEIDELESAIVKLSNLPAATRALLAGIAERTNAREIVLQNLITSKRNKE